MTNQYNALKVRSSRCLPHHANPCNAVVLELFQCEASHCVGCTPMWAPIFIKFFRLGSPVLTSSAKRLHSLSKKHTDLN